jgi:hypothetical protein
MVQPSWPRIGQLHESPTVATGMPSTVTWPAAADFTLPS